MSQINHPKEENPFHSKREIKHILGKPGCLKEKTFVITGTMEILTREEVEDLILRYGGTIRSVISSKTNYVILGSNPGQAKTEKIVQYKTKILSECEFLKMIQDSN